MDLLAVIAFAALGYGLGSIPFGLVLTRAAGLGDVRRIGSGNIGTTNVLRTGRRDLAAATLLLDALKGTAAVLIAMRWGPEAALAAGFFAFIGHLYPVWLRFRGGKGVATYIGVLLAFAPPVVIVFALAWIGTAAATRYSSLSALVASAATPLALLVFGYPTAVTILFAVLSAILIAKHRENISRLRAGTESRIGQKSAPMPPRG
jgi:acyl phosphate:glycerol-3-phosphate acyltransferase